MATESAFVWDESYKAAADLSASQFLAVEYTAVDTVNVCNAATDVGFGILLNKPKLGQAAVVRHLGVSKAVSDGSGTAIVAGDLVGPNAAGKLVKKAAADFSVIGQALDPSTANGTIIRVKLGAPGYFRTALG